MLGSIRRRLAYSGVSTARCCSRTLATAASLRKLPSEGEHLHGFVLKRSQRFEELQLTALELQHTKTGADYLHIARDDSNNVFSIGFKTNPPDATGVPHILEHTTLCGSEKYPVRDPFFKMLPRSLSNFMNAFTSSDHTTYPFSTTNAQDFRNLLSVYLDATLHPLLSKSDFEQEGWRVGPENPEAAADANGGEDSPQKLVFKGVVYNEMKGQMSDASYLYYIRYHEHIFPAINNSGGDPQAITNLTWEDLKRFHREHYHPSNAKIFTYGDMPLEDHLIEVNRQLGKFEHLQLDKAIKAPIELASPSQVSLEGPIDPLTSIDAQYKTSESWMLGDSSDVHESFALGVISQLLLDGYGSPLYRSLIEEGLGMDWSANTGLDTAGKRGIFCVGLNGVTEENVAKVKPTIQNVFRQMHENGFDRSKIDGILHQMDLGLKHKTANFGMSLMHRVQAGWFNGVDPFDALAWRSIVETFKTRLNEGRYLEELLEKYFLTDNTLTFTMRPSESYGQTIVQEEAKRLEGKLAGLTTQLGTEEKMRQELTAQELALLEKQNTEQDLSCLPMVRVKDIPREGVYKSTSESRIHDSPTQWRTTGTNGLTYFRGLNVLEGLDSELRLLLPLFSDAIMRIGTKNKSMEEIEDLIKAKTGGLSFGHAVLGSPTSSEIATEAFSMSGFALDSNVESMLNLLRMIVHETDFGSEKAAHMIKELLQSSANGALDNVASSGHSYARKYAESGLNLQGYLTEQVSGLDQVFYSARQAGLSVDEIAASLIEKLRRIQQFALTRSDKLRMAITCDQAAVKQNETHLTSFMTQLQASSSPSINKVDRSMMQTNAKTFFPLPYQVYYSATSIPTVPYIHEDSAPLAILAQLLTHQHLHKEIREKGGAYGGGAYSKGLSGIFGFYSYRDPNPQNTVKVVAEAGKWAHEKSFSDEQLESAKLSVFQGLDAPESVNQEGMTKFLSGITPEMEQKKREQLLDVSHAQVRDVAEKYIISGYAKSKSVILGEKQPWLAESSDWTVKSSQLGA